MSRNLFDLGIIQSIQGNFSKNCLSYWFLVFESAMCDMLGRPFDVWVIREFIPMESAFTAFNGLPINKERRYFIKDGEVICHHSYWPESAVAEGDPRSSSDSKLLLLDWREKLTELNSETEEEVLFISAKARKVSKHFEGAWTLDFSIGKDGLVYAIDIAVAEESYHYPDCPHSPESPF